MRQATSNDGVKIHYEVEGDGPPLLLQHGFSGSLLGWRDAGYVDALRSSYRLMLVDGRGHGQSDKPHDVESYAMQRRVDDALAVLEPLQTVVEDVFYGVPCHVASSARVYPTRRPRP